MAKNTDIAILDIGSQKFTAVVADGTDNILSIKKDSMCENAYAGFVDGQWVEPEKLKECISSLMKLTMVRSKTRPTTVYVGVPGEFTTVYCQEENIYFPPRKVNAQDVEDLFNSDDKVNTHSRYQVINKAPIYYSLSSGEKTLAPISIVSEGLSGMLSYILCDRNFIRDLTGILKGLGFENVKFVSSCLAEALNLFEAGIRDQSLILIDVGYITTTVSVVKADGILFMKSFSLGGAMISVDLATHFKIPFDVAESLKDSLRLSLSVTAEDTYGVSLNGQEYTFNAIEAHEIAIRKILEIAQVCQACIDKCKVQFKLPSDISVFLTGGGISYIQGAQVISEVLQKEIDAVAPTFQLLGKPNYSSTYGLLKYAGKEEQSQKKTLIGSLKKLFNK